MAMGASSAEVGLNLLFLCIITAQLAINVCSFFNSLEGKKWFFMAFLLFVANPEPARFIILQEFVVMPVFLSIVQLRSISKAWSFFSFEELESTTLFLAAMLYMEKDRSFNSAVAALKCFVRLVPSVLYDNNKTGSSSSSVDPMAIGPTRILDNDGEDSNGNTGDDNRAGIRIYLNRVFLRRMTIGEDVRTLEQLAHAVGHLANLAGGLHIFYYREVRGYIRSHDYQIFNEFKRDLHEVDIVPVGMGEIVNFNKLIPMEVDSTYMGVAIDDDTHVQDDNDDEASDANNGREGRCICLDRVPLDRMRIGEDVGSPEDLVHVVGHFADLADGRYIFYYRGLDGDYITRANYRSFNDFKGDLYEVDIVPVGEGETVSFP